MPSKPEPPYWAVIFPNQRTQDDAVGYAAAARRMMELAERQPGYLGADSARGADGFGITVSYWESLEAIQAWRNHPEHLPVQAQGRAKWYAHYDLHVARVERRSSFLKPE